MERSICELYVLPANSSPDRRFVNMLVIHASRFICVSTSAVLSSGAGVLFAAARPYHMRRRRRLLRKWLTHSKLHGRYQSGRKTGQLRCLCGWPQAHEIAHESTFSGAFPEFAHTRSLAVAGSPDQISQTKTLHRTHWGDSPRLKVRERLPVSSPKP